jgi:hydroxymethylpyrimidine/phosphomethylpyrimidine kinase / thiaminase
MTYRLLAAKSPSYAANESAALITLHIVRESMMHKSFCAQWDVSEDELENTTESAATMAYGSYLIDIGLQGVLLSPSVEFCNMLLTRRMYSGDDMKLIVALSACLLGYGEVGLWLKKEAAKSNSWVKMDGNPYLKWIRDYSGEDYQAAVVRGLGEDPSYEPAD